MRSPTCSRASIRLPSALPSGHTCAFIRTLPYGVPGRIGHHLSQATCHLPAAVSGGAPGTPPTRGGVTTVARRTTPGIDTDVGANVRRTLVGQVAADGDRGAEVVAAGVRVPATGSTGAGAAYAGAAPPAPSATPAAPS